MSKRALVIFILLLLSLSSGVIVFLSTANGPMGYSDSVAYIVSARNLIKGIGLGMFTPSGKFVVTYLHPPLYPLLLSGIGVLGVDLLDAARWCNILLSMVTVFTTGYIFLRYSRHPETAIVASVLIACFPPILVMFMSAMSELLFLFLLSLSCLLLIHYLQEQTVRNFVITALLFGLLPVTRYVGIAFFIPAVICVFLFSSGIWQERSKRSIAFGLTASIPLLIWLAVLYFGSDHALGGRSIQMDGEYLTVGFQTYRETTTEILWSWIPFSQRSVFHFLYPVRGMILLVVFLAFVMAVWRAGRHLVDKDKNLTLSPDVQLSVFFGVAVASYFVVFMGTWLFTIPQTPINDRLLMPIYFVAVLGLLSCWAVVQKAWLPKNLFMHFTPWLLTILMVSWYSPQVFDVIEQSYKNDTVLAYRWRDSQVIHALKQLPVDQRIISNKSETVTMWADRPAYDLMENLQPGFMKEASPYGSDDTDSAQKAFRQGAVLVVFKDFKNQFESTYGDRGKERLPTFFNGLTMVGQYPDGVIYRYSDK